MTELYVKRTDHPKNLKCARCGEPPKNHRVAGSELHCSPVAVRRVIEEGQTRSA